MYRETKFVVGDIDESWLLFLSARPTLTNHLYFGLTIHTRIYTLDCCGYVKTLRNLKCIIMVEVFNVEFTEKSLPK